MKLLREPLLHCLIVGALLFGVYEWLNRGDPGPPADNTIRIGEGEIRWLRQTFTNQWQREPTPAETSRLIATLVEEELLAREARSLGLDQHDTVVRRRLAQKIDFMVSDTMRIPDPGEDALRAFHATHAERYRTNSRISFSQIYFSRERRADAEGDATKALLTTDIGDAVMPAEGDTLLLDASYTDLDQQAVESLFGPDFAREVFALPTGSWRGPVRSAFGVHLVRVREIHPSRPKAFDEVRDTVTADWRRAQDIAARTAYLARLREKYPVLIDGSARKILASPASRQATP